MFFSNKHDITVTSPEDITKHITSDVFTNLAVLSLVYCLVGLLAYRMRGNEKLRGLLAWMGTFAAYLYMGACVFPYLEQHAEIDERRRVRHLLRAVRTNLTESVFEEIADAVAGPDWESKSTSSLSWTFDGAVFFSFTLMTTIGYGSFVPQTRSGRLFTICYAPVGIAIAALTYVRLAETLLSFVEDVAFALMHVDPLKIAFDDFDADHSGELSREEIAAMLTELGAELSLAQFEELMASALRHADKSMQGRRSARASATGGVRAGGSGAQVAMLPELISYEGFSHALALRPDLKKRVLTRSLRGYRWAFCFGTFGLMLGLCATVGVRQEGWTLVDSCYFAVVTFTTIGLGDFTPTIRDFATWGIWFYLIALGVTALLVSALLDIVPAVLGAGRDVLLEVRARLAGATAAKAAPGAAQVAVDGAYLPPPPAASTTDAPAASASPRARSRQHGGVLLGLPKASAKAAKAASPAAAPVASASAAERGAARKAAAPRESQRGAAGGGGGGGGGGGEFSKAQML